MGRIYTEEQKQRRRDLQKKYRNTDEYRAKARLYEQSRNHFPHVKAATKKYNEKYVASLDYKEKQKQKFKSPIERAKLFFKTIKRRAATNNIDFNLTIQWLEERLIRGICEVSGIAFNLDNFGKCHDKFYSPSVDRIDNSQGYTVDNCRMVLFAFNAGKHTGTDSDFIKLIHGLLENGFLNRSK